MSLTMTTDSYENIILGVKFLYRNIIYPHISIYTQNNVTHTYKHKINITEINNIHTHGHEDVRAILDRILPAHSEM